MSLFKLASPIEVAILGKLLEVDFPGRDELRLQLSGLLTRIIDSSGSLELRPGLDMQRANVSRRIPIEARSRDLDGVEIQVLLHVVDGRLSELEVFRGDGLDVRRALTPDQLQLFLLPDSAADPAKQDG